MQLSEHFTFEELTFSSTAVRRNIDNEPNLIVTGHLRTTAAGLERVRVILGAPLHIDSGYRSPALNTAVGGVSNSAHLSGFAADFVCPAFGNPLAIVHRLQTEAGLEFDQLIQEGTWVHISFAPTMRRMVLTAHFNGGPATYTHGA